MNRTLQISQQKISVELEVQQWGKEEVKVTLKNGYRAFVPSFTDIYRIIKAICEKEEERYPNGKGRKMVGEFLVDVADGMDYEKLIRKYDIPLTTETGERVKPSDIEKNNPEKKSAEQLQITDTISYGFLRAFNKPIEIGSFFDIANHTIWITKLDDENQRAYYIATERV